MLGYETKVLAGAMKILADQYLKGIIIELNRVVIDMVLTKQKFMRIY